MLFVLTGSSCSGKSTAARHCGRIERLAVHDFDEVGVPSTADVAWRQAALEEWLGRVLAEQARGVDVLLTCQSPLGEVLAVPSATELDGIAVALLEVDDRTRWIRLERRDPGKWDVEAKRAFIGWARWHRAHAEDPQAAPEVIVDGSNPGMAWERWASWTREDPRWQTELIDTTDVHVTRTAGDVRNWIARSRGLHEQGALPLGQGWDLR